MLRVLVVSKIGPHTTGTMLLREMVRNLPNHVQDVMHDVDGMLAQVGEGRNMSFRYHHNVHGPIRSSVMQCQDFVAGGYDVVVRAIRTPFIDEWEARRSEIEEQRSDLQSYMISKVSAGQSHEVLPGAGQSSGAITETKPAAQIVSDIMAEAEAALGSF